MADINRLKNYQILLTCLDIDRYQHAKKLPGVINKLRECQVLTCLEFGRYQLVNKLPGFAWYAERLPDGNMF